MNSPFPPSPALSICDSLADIDDLDAFLDAQGPLSHFGTPPPPKASSMVEVMEVFDEEEELVEDTVRLDYTHVATIFAGKAYTAAAPTAWEVEHIRDLLVNAKLPAEIIALTYNVVQTYHAVKRFRSEPPVEPGDLLVVSAMGLAVMYASDHPPKSSWWSRIVCNGIRSASEIDTATLDMLAALDWSLHALCAPSAIEESLSLLTGEVKSEIEMIARPQTPVRQPEPLKISLEGTEAVWAHGQLTPETMSPASATAKVEKNQFLPLL